MSATTPYDRTRWDRLQATLLVVTIAVVTSSPAWLTLSIITGHVIIGAGR